MASTLFVEHTDESEKALESLLQKIPTDQSKLVRWLLVQADTQIKQTPIEFTKKQKNPPSAGK